MPTENFLLTGEGAMLYDAYRGFAAARLLRDRFETLKFFHRNS